MVVLHFGQEGLEFLAARRRRFLQIAIGRWLEVAERQILEIAANRAHAQTVGDGRVDIQRLARDALLLFRRQIIQSTHVVEAVGQLHQTTRTSVTMARSILRTLSTWRTSGETSSRRLILVTPSTNRAISAPNSWKLPKQGRACLRPHRAAARRKAW